MYDVILSKIIPVIQPFIPCLFYTVNMNIISIHNKETREILWDLTRAFYRDYSDNLVALTLILNIMRVGCLF